jgi:MinD-like ATPase involved in chromosome partitioning or flagellar assembly
VITIISIEAIKQIKLFSGLEDHDLKKIAEVVKERNLPAGTTLFKEGDVGDAFYLLKDGVVEVNKENSPAINDIKSTDESNFFGEMALVEGAPRNATIRTKSECTLLEIDKVNFDMLLRLNSFIALRIMTALTQRIRKTTSVMKAVTVEEEKCGKLITLFSPKGGAGKSVTAANMSAGIAKLTGKKALLIDLDLQFGDLAFMLGLKPKRSIADLVEAEPENADDLKKFLTDHPHGFSVLPSPFKPEQSEMVTSNHLRKLIKIAKTVFDYIIVDTHSLFQDLTINSLDISDYICLIMAPELTHIKSMIQCMKVVETLKYPPEKIRMILNREECMYAIARAEIEASLKRKFDFSLHDDWKNALSMVNEQKTIFDTTNESTYRTDFVHLITGLTGEKITEEAQKSGLLGTLKGWFGGKEKGR